jgi:hypothetical protein
VVLDACDDIPKSFLVCDHPYHKQLVYISQLNTQTLQKRTENDQPAVTGGQGKERTHV